MGGRDEGWRRGRVGIGRDGWSERERGRERGREGEREKGREGGRKEGGRVYYVHVHPDGCILLMSEITSSMLTVCP